MRAGIGHSWCAAARHAAARTPSEPRWSAQSTRPTAVGYSPRYDHVYGPPLPLFPLCSNGRVSRSGLLLTTRHPWGRGVPHQPPPPLPKRSPGAAPCKLWSTDWTLSHNRAGAAASQSIAYCDRYQGRTGKGRGRRSRLQLDPTPTKHPTPAAGQRILSQGPLSKATQ